MNSECECGQVDGHHRCRRCHCCLLLKQLAEIFQNKNKIFTKNRTTYKYLYICVQVCKCAFYVNQRRAATAAHLMLLRAHGWWAPAAFLCRRKCWLHLALHLPHCPALRLNFPHIYSYSQTHTHMHVHICPHIYTIFIFMPKSQRVATSQFGASVARFV